MKRLKFIYIILLLFFASPLMLMAQEPGGDVDLTAYFVSIPAIAAFTLIATQFIKNSFDIGGTVSQYLSWAVSFILCGIGYWLQLGIMTGLEWYYIFIYGLASGLIANGLYDWNWIKAILQLLKLLPSKKPGF